MFTIVIQFIWPFYVYTAKNFLAWRVSIINFTSSCLLLLIHFQFVRVNTPIMLPHGPGYQNSYLKGYTNSQMTHPLLSLFLMTMFLILKNGHPPCCPITLKMTNERLKWARWWERQVLAVYPPGLVHLLESDLALTDPIGGVGLASSVDTSRHNSKVIPLDGNIGLTTTAPPVNADGESRNHGHYPPHMNVQQPS